jgi:hypothetical protein
MIRWVIVNVVCFPFKLYTLLKQGSKKELMVQNIINYFEEQKPLAILINVIPINACFVFTRVISLVSFLNCQYR